MARFTITTPAGIRIVYGWDPASGFFIEIMDTRRRRRIISYDMFSVGYDGLRGILQALADSGIVTGDDIHAALDRIPHLEDVSEIEDDCVRLVAQIVSDLKRAAG